MVIASVAGLFGLLVGQAIGGRDLPHCLGLQQLPHPFPAENASSSIRQTGYLPKNSP